MFDGIIERGESGEIALLVCAGQGEEGGLTGGNNFWGKLTPLLIRPGWGGGEGGRIQEHYYIISSYGFLHLYSSAVGMYVCLYTMKLERKYIYGNIIQGKESCNTQVSYVLTSCRTLCEQKIPQSKVLQISYVYYMYGA